MRRLSKSGFIWLVLSLLLFFASVGGVMKFWGWLHPSAPTTVSNSETLRNVGFLVAGLLAFVFAGWRACVAERQANAAQQQSEVAQQSLLNERYQRGAEMLGNSVLAVRLGAIDALTRLAEQHPREYHVQVMGLMCAFAKECRQINLVQIIIARIWQMAR